MMGHPSVSGRPAEKGALDGDNESQDSQQVLEAYMKYRGIGITSSSPPLEERIALPAQRQIASLGSLIGDKSTPLKPRIQKPVRSASVSQTSRIATPAASVKSLNQTFSTRRAREVIPPDFVTDLPISPPVSEVRQGRDAAVHNIPRRSYPDRDAGIQIEPADARLAQTSAHPDGGRGPLASKTVKMDPSPSPTQSNDGRSYEQYFRTSSPAGKLQDEDKTLCEDDTGAVNFNLDDIGDTKKTGLSFQEEPNVPDLGGLSRLRNMAAQDRPPPLPETPAPPQNPFRHGRSQLLAPSQLFGATQFSSAIKQASPTSSRPSPNDFPRNSISPNPPAVSSPLKARGLRSSPPPLPSSSSQILPGTTSTGLDGRSSPVVTTSAKTPVVPDSQSSRLQRKRSVPEPMSTYEPMHKSQERRYTSDAQSPSGTFVVDEDVEDDAISRKLKAKSKQEAALRQLNAISFARPARSDDVEVPSTNRRKRKVQADAYLTQCYGPKKEGIDFDVEHTVADSQEIPAKLAQGPPLSDGESTQSEPDEVIGAETQLMPDTAPTLPAPPVSPPILLARSPDEGPGRRESGDAIPETSPSAIRPAKPRPSPDGLPLMKVKTAPDFRSSPPALSTRSKMARASKGSTSSLTNLASTPSVSSSGLASQPPSAKRKPAAAAAAAVAEPASSPPPPKPPRRGAVSRLPKLKTGSLASLKSSTRSARRLSSSTDEITRSATVTPTVEHSLRASRMSLSKPGRVASKNQPAHQGPKIFNGMAFAISFQSKRHGETNDQYGTRVEFANTIEKLIKQAGGRVLNAGFDELFDISPVRTASGSPSSSPSTGSEISLNDLGRGTGFTALIADGHSRKVKYMQALALGLPCLAGRWVTSCLERGELIDWSPYLLCAGQSAYLGDAIRSRNLTPYDASTARLVDVVDRRTKLLEESTILLVMKKSLEGKKMAYVFLARILGASVSRVYSAEEARAEVKAAEDEGRTFDWVYVDGKEDAGDLFGAPGTSGKSGSGRKRKRASAAASTSMVDEPVTKKIRTLSDELVIQSLILGRLIGEGEMEG